MPDTTGEPFPGVADWAARHKVCWELLPLQEIDPHGARMQVGYELTLLAQPGTAGPADDSSPEIADLLDKLRLIARGALPEEALSSEFDLSPFDWSQHMRVETDWAPEIQLTLRVFNKGEYFAPPDADEHNAVKQIEARLRSFGLRPGAWRTGSRS